MAIHQIQMRHDQKHDRILLRVSTTDGKEFRFWLTRRFVKRVWGLLVKMLQWDRAVHQQADPQTRQTVLDIRHEGFVQQGDFTKPFEEAPHEMPLGDEPLLVTRGAGKRTDNGLHMLSLHPEQGQGIDMTLDNKLLHLFTKLLREAVSRADWALDLNLHPGGQAAAPDAPLPREKLN